MFLQKSLRAKILALLGGSLLLILITALACFSFLSAGIQSYKGLLEGPMATSSLAEAANLSFKTQVQEWKNVLLRGSDKEQLDRYWGQFEAQERKVQDMLAQLGTLTANDPALKNKVERLRNEHQQMGSDYREGLNAFIAAGADASAGDKAVSGIDRNTTLHLDELSSELQKRSLEQSNLINASADRTISLGSLLMVGASIVIGLFSLWLINRSLITPIRELIEHITQLSHGNLANRVQSKRQDELGNLALSANILRDFLADTFASLQRTTSELDTASGQLNSIATLMNQGTRDQFTRTDQVAAAMHEMSATSQEVAQHAAEAAAAADAADNATRQGDRVMEATIKTITDIRSEISNTAQVIGRLEDDSERISKVLEVIRGIAEQTNLLALNAAIEAARAGEHGRGFAVVADEVRTLARRTAESIAEIHQIIDTVQTGAANAVRAIENGQQRSEAGVSQVTEAGASLKLITQAVEAIRDMNRQIATAAEEQTAVAEDISRNLTEITAIATTNQAHLQRTEAAAGDLFGLSAQLTQVTQRLSN